MHLGQNCCGAGANTSHKASATNNNKNPTFQITTGTHRSYMFSYCPD